MFDTRVVRRIVTKVDSWICGEAPDLCMYERKLLINLIQDLIQHAVAEEREACAVLVEDFMAHRGAATRQLENVARTIRSRK